eukprot:CAMPEP_0172473676 /NCGR_PEP_ID=MMETSP1065-20121228/68974_1 /TAXON_ID=265537 /ORGANISM="Amphiprora paludosa, Strain CCMP125" /LENGTH=508 /DNA_ID=CAMNT_0013231851 /DNA_START=120 /DNA_END=1646 /DNA_ORIENTATION=-
MTTPILGDFKTRLCLLLPLLLSAAATAAVPNHRETATAVCAGNLECLNNGQCASGHEEWMDSNLQQPLCDCSTAFAVLSGTISSIARYVGVTCETPVEPFEYCQANDADWFCVNGGTCHVNDATDEPLPCLCPTGYTGRHCEYETPQVEDCTLTCSGRGTCVVGMKIDTSDHSVKSGKDPNAPLDLTHGGTDHYMHCECDPGNAGIACEYEYIQCNQDQEQFCYHGSTCATDGSGQCVCDYSGRESAGTFCEYLATDRCNAEPSLPLPSQPLNEEGFLTFSDVPFCVNNGVCVQEATNDNLYYCECPNGFEGKRCEYLSSSDTEAPISSPTEAPTSSPTPDDEDEDDMGSEDDGDDGDDDDDDGDDDEPTPAPTPYPTHIAAHIHIPPSIIIHEEEDDPTVLPGSVIFSIILIVLVVIGIPVCLALHFKRRRGLIIKRSMAKKEPDGDALFGYNIGDEREEEVIEWMSASQEQAKNSSTSGYSATAVPQGKAAPPIEGAWVSSALVLG